MSAGTLPIQISDMIYDMHVTTSATHINMTDDNKGDPSHSQ